MQRETVYAALFSLLSPLVGDRASGLPLRVASRRMEFAEDVPAESTPGVWQLQLDERVAVNGVGGFIGWHLHVDWYVYVTQNDEAAPSSPLFNPVLDAVTAVLPNETMGTALRIGDTTIGVSFREAIKVYEGILNNKAVVQIPLRLLVPNTLTGD